MEPETWQVMEYNAETGEYTFRNFTPEEQAENDAREAAAEPNAPNENNSDESAQPN